MDDDSLAQVEAQLASLPTSGPPAALRTAVLTDVQRELRAACWDRRLACLAAALLVAGVGMNMAIALRPEWNSHRFANHGRPEAASSFVDTAIAVAEATDGATARNFTRQLATMAGYSLTADELEAIDAAVGNRAATRPMRNRG